MKYLVLSALSTGFLVYGITWIFGVTGETNLQRITAVFTDPNVEQGAALFGAVLVLVGLGFKIAAVPFQIWVPDVYQGAPTPVTAYLSVGSKAAGFVVLLRVLRPFLMLPQMGRLIVLIALLTLIYGNLAALPQSNLKRLLAYSSIAHAGYLLIGVACFDGPAVTFYLVAYLLMTMLSFAVLIIVAQQTGERIADFDGLAKRSPVPRLRHVDRDDLSRRCAVHRRILRKISDLRGGDQATSDRARRRRCPHRRLRILLLSQSRPRDVLANYRQDRCHSGKRFVSPRDDRINHCDHLARDLSAADSEALEALKGLRRRYKAVGVTRING